MFDDRDSNGACCDLFVISKSYIHYQRKFFYSVVDFTKRHFGFHQSRCWSSYGSQRFTICIAHGHDNLYRHRQRFRRHDHNLLDHTDRDAITPLDDAQSLLNPNDRGEF